jgi:hypothetical protein
MPVKIANINDDQKGTGMFFVNEVLLGLGRLDELAATLNC